MTKITPEMTAAAIAEVRGRAIPADVEIEAGIAADPDAAPVTTGPAATSARVKWIRRATGLTQVAFAERYGIPLGTLRDWEQGQVTPDATARSYLRAIEKAPEAVARALAA